MSHTYDPELQPLVEYLPTIDLRDIAGTRQSLRDAAAAFPPYAPANGIVRETLIVPGGGSGPDVELQVVRPEVRSSAAPAVVWFHGGGFVLGDARESLPFLENVALETGAVAMSVQYRLSPETRYPGAVDDGVAAVRWLIDRAEVLGIDPARVALGGQSAGGAYAAGVALRLRDESGPALRLLVLDVPVTDDRVATDSALSYEETPMWNRRNAELSWRAYLGDGGVADAYAAPARAESLAGLPPTFIAVNQFDPLRDEGLEFARRLAHAGVPTEAHLYAGTFHASAGIAAGAEVSRRQLADMRAAFERAFRVPSTGGAEQ